jgi:hypothetical protein
LWITANCCINTSTKFRLHRQIVNVLFSQTYVLYSAGIRTVSTLPCRLTTIVTLGGLVVSVLATGPKVRGFDPDRVRWIFKGDKNPEHNFLRRIELVMSVSKIQAAISHQSLLTACQMALAVTSGLSKNLCGQWAGHSLQNAHLPTRKPSGCLSPDLDSKTDCRMKRLRTCRKTDCRMKRLRPWRKTDCRMNVSWNSAYGGLRCRYVS